MSEAEWGTQRGGSCGRGGQPPGRTHAPSGAEPRPAADCFQQRLRPGVRLLRFLQRCRTEKHLRKSWNKLQAIWRSTDDHCHVSHATETTGESRSTWGFAPEDACHCE